MQKTWIYVFILFCVACAATAGSLFFSEVMEFPPCVLCWYQRIAMYPLVLIFGVAVIQSTSDFLKYTIPLSVIGWVIAFWHNLLHFEIISEDMSPCIEGVPCSTVYIELFGFLTIPMMSFVAFSLILIFSFLFHKESHE